VEVDGSSGEGGGQILRTAVSFSVILNKPVRVTKIRAGRPEPGLRRQHMWALLTARDLFGGELAGAEVGSTEVSYVPGKLHRGSATVDMETAASITLLLQTLVPAVALTGRGLELDVAGGTDVPWSPTFDYVREVVRPALSAVGIEFEVEAARRGYYPRGGGRVRVKVLPSKEIRGVNWRERPMGVSARIVSRGGSLPPHVAERQAGAAKAALIEAGVDVAGVQTFQGESDSPGSSVLAYGVGDGVFLGSDCIGAKGVPAEEVGMKAAEGFVSSFASKASVDPHLADMVVPLLSLAAGESAVCTPEVTSHLETGMALATQFTSRRFIVERGQRNALVRVA